MNAQNVTKAGWCYCDTDQEVLIWQKDSSEVYQLESALEDPRKVEGLLAIVARIHGFSKLELPSLDILALVADDGVGTLKLEDNGNKTIHLPTCLGRSVWSVPELAQWNTRKGSEPDDFQRALRDLAHWLGFEVRLPNFHAHAKGTHSLSWHIQQENDTRALGTSVFPKEFGPLEVTPAFEFILSQVEKLEGFPLDKLAALQLDEDQWLDTKTRGWWGYDVDKFNDPLIDKWIPVVYAHRRGQLTAYDVAWFANAILKLDLDAFTRRDTSIN